MPLHWCVNFDDDSAVLNHGLEISAWLMQYQYSHTGEIYQGHADQFRRVTRNWNAVRDIKSGDWLIAYLPQNRFYAIGQVIAPRVRDSHRGQPSHEDTEDAEALTKAIMAAGILPPHAFPDAAHVAVSAVHAVDFLLTWICKHLANAQIARRIASGVRDVEPQNADYLYARRTHGSLASCGKTRSSRKSIAPARS